MSCMRQQMWEQLGGEKLDLLVIGGGINGAGIARDAALRGLKVAVVEARDLAYGTSSRSSKLIHGGLRYLEQLEFSLVFEAVSERRILMDIAPHLVEPLGFLFPVYKNSRQSLTMINTGLWLYEGLSLFRSPKRHRKLTLDDIRRHEPALKTEGLKGAPLYYDGATDDARLTLESALDAADHGAVVATWTKAVSFLKDETSGRINGAVVKDMLGNGELKEVHASAVINATGPWTDRTRKLSTEQVTEVLRPTKGVHVVVERDRLPVNNAIVCFHPTDERVLFAIPWGEQTYLGTTDTDFDGDPGQVMADGDDVAYLLDAAREYFPDYPLRQDDVISTWAGLRPLVAPSGVEGDDISASDVSREHQILIGEDGLITVAGGKLTTYRRMSAEVVDTAVKFLRLDDALPERLEEAQTDRRPLPGARGWPDDDEAARAQYEEQCVDHGEGHVDEETARFLVNTYGVRAPDIAQMVGQDPELGEPLVEGRPEIMAQVDWAVTQELAATVTDMLLQRTQIYYRAPEQGLEAVNRIADRMGQLLGWDEVRKQQEIERYHRDVEHSRRWRDDDDDEER